MQWRFCLIAFGLLLTSCQEERHPTHGDFKIVGVAGRFTFDEFETVKICAWIECGETTERYKGRKFVFTRYGVPGAPIRFPELKCVDDQNQCVFRVQYEFCGDRFVPVDGTGLLIGGRPAKQVRCNGGIRIMMPPSGLPLQAEENFSGTVTPGSNTITPDH
jgi:hypothetical protein